MEKTGLSLKFAEKKAAQGTELTKGKDILVRVPGLLPKENRRLILEKKEPSFSCHELIVSIGCREEPDVVTAAREDTGKRC